MHQCVEKNVRRPVRSAALQGPLLSVSTTYPDSTGTQVSGQFQTTPSGRAVQMLTAHPANEGVRYISRYTALRTLTQVPTTMAVTALVQCCLLPPLLNTVTLMITVLCGFKIPQAWQASYCLYL